MTIYQSQGDTVTDLHHVVSVHVWVLFLPFSINFIIIYSQGKAFLSGHKGKLRQLGFPNQVINDSDSKPSEFDCRYWSDSRVNFPKALNVAEFNGSKL